MRFGLAIAATAILLTCMGASVVLADPPATQPVAATNRTASIKQWFADLAHPDSTVREAARLHLLGMRRSDLPTLRAAVQEGRPLSPSQATALPDIVTHVFLAGDTYPPDADKGFLGVSLPRDGEMEAPVVVVERIPGFCAFRFLQDGDVIRALVGPPEVRFNNPTHFRQTVADIPPGKEIELEVLRQGQVIHVVLTLDVRPKQDDPTMGQFKRERDQKAYTYWQENFAALVGDEVS